MAPVAGRVPDREKDRFVFSPSFLEGLITPREPVDWIVSVLEKIGTLLVDEAVRCSVCGHLLD
jgi:hypothetical protein